MVVAAPSRGAGRENDREERALTRQETSWLRWGARVSGILVVLFAGVFALDALHEGLVAFLIHLVPALFLALIVALAWRWQLVGAIAFTALGLLYGATTLDRPDWILTIAGPLVLVGTLYLWSWRRDRTR